MSTDDLFRDGLLATVPHGEWVPAVVAQNYVELLAVTDPALLDAWLHEHAAAFATDVLVRWERHARAASRRHASAREFADNGSDAEWIGSFSITYCISGDNARLQVAEMTGLHHRYVASEYEASAKTGRMLAAFHRAVAKKVGARRTVEVFSEATYDALYRSIVRGAPTAVAS